MTAEQWQRAREVFEAALACGPEERDDFIIAACGADAGVLAEVRKLLLAHDEAGSFLEKPAVEMPTQSDTLISKVDYTGKQIGPWRMLREIGRGGMGEVYRARDTRLGRDVAIKVLPAAFSRDADRLRRFELEARAASALNHPNILTIYDIGSHDGAPYIVAELLEGEDLRAELRRGALPVQRAVEYARQIAGGLAAAHEKGVVHRDLKPENLFVTKDGRVKILDFGLARMNAQPGEAFGLESATRKQITAPGVVMGTVGYMSPEQVRGQVADHRADIFSFGAILYEMLSGRRAFQGETAAEVMTAVLKADPPPIALASGSISPMLERVVRHCLEKRPERRFQSARDLEFALGALSGGSGSGEAADGLTSAASLATARRKSRERLLWGTAVSVLGVAVVGTVYWLLASRTTSPPIASQPVRRMTIKLPDSEPLALTKFGTDTGLGRSCIALSPDGRSLVYAGERNGKPQLYLRPLDQFEAKPIPGSEGAYDPFFSPDGRQVGFFASGKLKKVSLQGGEPVTLCEARTPYGASWGPDDTIVFAESEAGRLSRIPASGGKPLTLFRDASPPAYPQFLPGGKALLYSSGTDNYAISNIAVLSLDTGERRVLIEGGTNPRYAISGHLVFARADGMLAVPFDLSSLEVTGPAVMLAEGVRIEEWGATQFTLSQEGVLVYVSGGPAWIGKFTWVDRQGVSKPLAAPAQTYGSIHLSPDGQRLAAVVRGATSDVWVYEFMRGTFTRLTVEEHADSPRWTPDGKRVGYFRSNASNQYEIVWRMADGSGGEEVLTTGKYGWPESWSPDGKLLAFTEWTSEGNDLWVLPLEGDRKPQPWLKTKYNEYQAAFSRDGKYIAYVSDESGQFEVYVRPYPGPGGKWQISTNGGTRAVWSRDGRELFYREGYRLMSVAVQTEPGFRAEAPHQMFGGPYLFTSGLPYDVAPDGQRFIMIEEAVKQPPITHLNVVLNWFEELKRRVPTKGD